jgi:uncharacterized protein YaeQ
MALTATMYRVKMSLSDVDRGVYEDLSFRVACHPSESMERLVTRILAYGLLHEPGLEFGRGVSDADEPALWAHDLTGRLLHWIDVGTPAADRIHTASKKADRVSIVCHKGREALERNLQRRKIHRSEDIEVLLLDPGLVADLAADLERTSQWTVVHTDGELSIGLGDRDFTGTVTRIALPG